MKNSSTAINMRYDRISEMAKAQIFSVVSFAITTSEIPTTIKRSIDIQPITERKIFMELSENMLSI